MPAPPRHTQIPDTSVLRPGTVTELHRHLASFPQDAAAWNRLAQVQQALGNANAALESASHATTLQPEQADFWLTQAQLKLQARQWASARLDFEHVIRLDPNRGAAYSALAHIALQQSDFDTAERHFKLALRTPELRADVHLGYGNLLLHRGQHDEALRQLTQAAQIDPQQTAVQVSLGRAYLAQGAHAFAEQALRNALTREPEHALARATLVQALCLQGRNAEARAEIGRLPRDSGHQHVVHALLGDLARNEQRPEDAIAHYQQALQAKPDQPHVLLALGNALAQGDRFRAAVPIYVHYLQLRPDDQHVRRALAHAALHAGQYSLAHEQFTVLAKLQPRDPAIQMGIASCSEAMGAWEAADQAATLVLQRNPNHPGATLIKARGALRQGQYAAAESRLAPLDSTALNDDQRHVVDGLLGLALDGQGYLQEAAAAWRRRHARQPPAALPALAAPSSGAHSQTPTAGEAPAGQRPFALLLGAPGSGVEQVAALLARLPGTRLLSDRFRGGRRDGFTEWDAGANPANPVDAHRFARAYTRALRRFDIDAQDRCIDWLPVFDARLIPWVATGFGAVPIIIVQRSLDDALLHWLAFGCAQGWALAEFSTAREYLRCCAQHLDRWQAAHQPVITVEGDQAYAHPERVLRHIADALGAAMPDDPADLAALGSGLGGVPLALRRGRGTDYAKIFLATNTNT